MNGVRTEESGGRYDTPPNRAGASGGYQFIDSTWGNYGGYAKAYLAPPAIQDQRARQLMTAYYQKFGDWNSVAQAWLGGPGSVGKHVSDGNITTDAYAVKVLGYAGMGGGSGAPAPTGIQGDTSTPNGMTQTATTSTTGPDPHDIGTQLGSFLSMVGVTPQMPTSSTMGA